MGRRTAVAAWCLVVGALLVAACSGASPRTLPPPSSTSSTLPEVTTSSIDLSQVPLATVPGQTTTTIIPGGRSTLTGRVVGPEGDQAGAVVRIERLVTGATVPYEVRTAEDGTWMLQGLPGGRFRVRAYLPPELTLVEPAVFFLTDGETRDVPLTITPFVGLDVVAGTTPAQPFVGQAISVAVRVAERFVGDDGVGRTRPVPGVAVRVLATGWRTIDDGSPPPTTTTTTEPDDDDRPGRGATTTTTTRRAATTTTTTEAPRGAVTDADGTVVLTFACDRATPVTATALVGDDEESFTLEVPDCLPVPTTTTQAADPADPSATTTTTTP